MTAAAERTDFEAELEPHRRELTGYCYRMLGSASEAEDATQETLIRAWRGFPEFERRSSVRSWLYKIGTNVCLDMLKSSQRRARPVDLGPSTAQPQGPGEPLTASSWIQPVPDRQVLPSSTDPAELAVQRESIRLAFVAALQYLPPRQRAALILCEVLRWHADEVASLLDMSVPAVNSALQRARATLAQRQPDRVGEPATDDTDELVARYVDAFERYDIDELVTLLRADATLSMPPYSLWIQGPEEIARWHLGPGAECRGSRLVATNANGQPAFGQYRPSGPGGSHRPFSLQVLDITGGRIAGLNAFLDPDTLFPMFGLPAEL